MSAVSEQFWYTWSDWGFGNTNGFQIRAISDGLKDARGAVDMRSTRFQILMRYVKNYVLPQDADRSSGDVLKVAPISLSYIKAEQESLIVNKTYTGRDGVDRDGAFFAHLLTLLPNVPSLHPSGQIGFSAREAISLWHSPFWKSKNTLARGDTRLLQAQVLLAERDTASARSTTLNVENVPNGPLSEHDLQSLKEEDLLFLIQAFLRLDEGKHLYIAAPPDVVAKLVWAITHCSPRTLNSMQSLTFSTYERDIEEKMPLSVARQGTATTPVIVGTCWLNQPQDLPALYYQEQGVNGFALNWYTGRKTPLTVSQREAKFAQFAVNCLLGKNDLSKVELDSFLDECESLNVTNIEKLLDRYALSQETVSREHLIALLDAYTQLLQTLIQPGQVQEQEQTLLSCGAMRLHQVTDLQKENVQRSFITWLSKDTQWWRQDLEQRVRILREQVKSFTALFQSSMPLSQTRLQLREYVLAPVVSLINRVAGRVHVAIHVRKDTEATYWTNIFDGMVSSPLSFSSWLFLLNGLSIADMDTSTGQAWWRSRGAEMTQAMRPFANERRATDGTTPLTAFSEKIADLVVAKINRNDGVGLSHWQQVLCSTASASDEPVVWAYILQALASQPYNEAYLQWWNQDGKKEIGSTIQTLIDTRQGYELASILSFFAAQAGKNLQIALASDSKTTTLFWGDVLMASAPPAREQHVWAEMLGSLSAEILNTLAYLDWWKAYGQRAVWAARTVVSTYGGSLLSAPLRAFALNIVLNVHRTLTQNNQDNQDAVHFWYDMLITAAPPANEPDISIFLLQHLLQTDYIPAYLQWWEMDGKRAIETSVRSISNHDVAVRLTDLIAQAQQKLQYAGDHDDVATTVFVGGVLVSIAPAATRAEVWIDFLCHLSMSLYTSAYQQWWNMYGQTTIPELRSLVGTGVLNREIFSGIALSLTEKIQNAMGGNAFASLTFWSNILRDIVPIQDEPGIWMNLLYNVLGQFLFTQAYQWWWQEQGKKVTSTLHTLVEGTFLNTPVAREFDAFVTSISENLLELLVALAQEADGRSIQPVNSAKEQSCFFLLEILDVALPVRRYVAVWQDILHKLQPSLRRPVYDVYSLGLRTRLLHAWGKNAVLTNDALIHPWLSMRWSEFIGSNMPPRPLWLNVAASYLVRIVPDDTVLSGNVITIINHEKDPFEQALQNLMAVNTTQFQAIDFFAYLARNGYSRKVPLLGRLLLASIRNPDGAEKLLQSVQLEPEEQAAFLSSYCSEVLKSHPLPPKLIKMIADYLYTLDINYLGDATRKFLENLQQRTQKKDDLPRDLLPYIDGWLNLSTLVSQVNGRISTTAWIEQISVAVRDMSHLQPGARTKLTAKLIPLLITAIEDAMDLTRVIDNMGTPLYNGKMAPNNDLEGGFFLLRSMLVQVKKKHKRELPRLIPYIQFILKASEKAESAKRYSFVDECFAILLGDSNELMLNQLSDNAALWPPKLATAWNEYERSQAEQALVGFRDALSAQIVVAIANQYMRIPSHFHRYLNSSEQELAQRAVMFDSAYKSNDDIAFVQAVKDVEASEYVRSGVQLIYPPPAIDRWNAIALALTAGANNGSSPSTLSSTKNPTEMTNDEKVVAHINGKDVLDSIFFAICDFKKPYTAFRISTLKTEIQQAKRRGEKRQKKQELRYLEKIQANEWFPQATLDNIVAEILIPEEIDMHVVRNETPKGAFEKAVNAARPAAMNGFKAHPSYKDSVIQDYNLPDDKLWEILETFVQYEVFLQYKYKLGFGEKAMHIWIEATKNKEGNDIDYKAIGLTPPNKPNLFDRFMQWFYYA